jgi:hypothetical protein
MFNKRSGKQLPASCYRLPIIILALAVTACELQHSAILKVNPRHDAGVEYAPQELTKMMTGLGYQQLRVKDPVTEQSVTIAEKYGEYRMLFQSLENNNIRVDIHIDMLDGRIALYFYNINSSAFNSSSLQLYEQLRKRLELEYGAENVSSEQLAGKS